jgi:hypothetical protein
MNYPADHFPGTPPWFREAVLEAILRAVVGPKWQVPLEAIGRFESNYGVNANFCSGVQTDPVGVMQVSRSMLLDAKVSYPRTVVGLTGLGDPVLQVLTAIWHINSDLNVTGGYGGLGAVDGNGGLLPRHDRGPGDVLRYWIANPYAGIEDMRPSYHGY